MISISPRARVDLVVQRVQRASPAVRESRGEQTGVKFNLCRCTGSLASLALECYVVSLYMFTKPLLPVATTLLRLA